MAPKATQGEVLARLNAGINDVAMSAEVAERLRGLGAAPSAMTPEAQIAFMKSERSLWGGIARAANVEVQ